MAIQPWQAPVPIIGAGGRATPEWLRWLQQLLTNSGTVDTNSAAITTLESLVATLQAAVKALQAVPATAITLETNYALNGNQSKLDLVAGANISIWDTGSGDIIISGSAGGTTLTLEINGTANGSQTLLNLVAGTNITLTDDGSGDITIAGAASYTPANHSISVKGVEVSDDPVWTVNAHWYSMNGSPL